MKGSSRAFALMSMLTGLFGGMLPQIPPPAVDFSPLPATRRRTRSRIPFGNTVKGEDRQRYNADTNTLAGHPGSKLARKAAEGRIGRRGGRAPSLVQRALSK